MSNPADPDPYELRPRLQARTEQESRLSPPPGSRAARRERLRWVNRPSTSPGVRSAAVAAGAYPRRVQVTVHRAPMTPTTLRNLDTHLRYIARDGAGPDAQPVQLDRKSTRLNSSHVKIS